MAFRDNRGMGDKSKTPSDSATEDADWFFKEWAAHRNIRFPHAWLVREMQWSDGKASNVLQGKKRYDRDIINTVSRKLGIKPYMLLMHPDDVEALRQQREASVRVSEIELS